MTALYAWLAISGVLGVTATASVRGLRVARSTSDFYVASRGVRPWWNASAIGGEYLAAASVLGVAGLFLDRATDAVWLIVGFTGGFLILLLFVAAPLRRSNAYTVADFAQARYDSLVARRTFTWCVCLVCLLYIVPQLHGAALVASTVLRVPSWVGPSLVAVVVALTVVSGGMRSITLAQAPQYWIKVITFLVPLVVMLAVLPDRAGDQASNALLLGDGDAARSPYWTVSLLMALLLGTAGLPHVLVRFCTSPDGRTAQRTAAIVLVLVGAFYVLPVAYGVLGRRFAAGTSETDTLVLVLPTQLVGSRPGQALTAIVAAGVFSTLLATSSGLIMTIAGVVSQDLFGASIRGFRLAALGATGLTLILALATDSARLTDTVGHVFAFTASTIFPALVLGIWSRHTTAAGAVAGMVLGGALVVGSAVTYYGAGRPAGAVGDLLAQPAGWTVPVVGVAIVAMSRWRPAGEARTLSTERFLLQLHSPDERRASEETG
jgi:cation/acetate symporter